MRIALLAACCVALIGEAGAAPRERDRDAKSPSSPCPPGFAALQSSDACVRIGGRVRAETIIGSPHSRSSDTFGTRVGGRLQLEVRKPTENGPLRAVIRTEAVR